FVKDTEILSVLKIFNDNSVVSNEKASKLPSPKLQRVYSIKVKDTTKLKKLIGDLGKISFVEFVERVPIYEVFYTPNDINANQWNITKTQIPQAWDLSKGTSTVVIAIVDDAVRLDHQDLAGNIWVNPGEIAGNNIDDDGNGYVDDINGYDVADNDNNPTTPPSATNSEFTHGTHCAGIADAKTDNALGITSPGFSCKIMAVKTKPSADLGASLPYAYQGLEYAISAGADVISMSWGGYMSSNYYQLVIDFAYSKGIVMVAAAGNSNTIQPMYPASYNHVISVGATDINDLKASFSNYGPTLDVVAPGVNIWSSLAGSTASYGFRQRAEEWEIVLSSLLANSLVPSLRKGAWRNSRSVR
ncbi:MAG: S8 family serine peptidase, partial [Cytophagales bacterium]|nr:S8 family serine peptidase [Cytophagales bacterium]